MSNLNKLVSVTPFISNQSDIFQVYIGKEPVFKACADAIEDLTTRNNLTIFDRIPVKRVLKMLRRSGSSEYNDYIKYFTYSKLQLACVDDDLKQINNYIKANGLTDIVKAVYDKLKNRDINPSGEFDKQGRWYADNSELINCRAPSHAWPYSQMTACRTLKYVKKVAAFNGAKTESELLNQV